MCSLYFTITQSHNPLGYSVLYFTEYHFDIRYLNYTKVEKKKQQFFPFLYEVRNDARANTQGIIQFCARSVQRKYNENNKKTNRQNLFSCSAECDMWIFRISEKFRVFEHSAYNNIHLPIFFHFSLRLFFSYSFFFYFFFNKEVVQRLCRQHCKQTNEENQNRKKEEWENG